MLMDYYNEDPVPFDSIPFHLYPKGMAYVSRRGNINVHEVVCHNATIGIDDLRVLSSQHLMWVDLTAPLQPGQCLSLEMSFTTTLPDGGLDRSGEYGFDANETRIFTYASAYPLPCVYDQYDGWNVDPYIEVGDPFYLDMALYDLTIDVPNGMIVAATGSPVDVVSDDGRTIYYYDIPLPVREVTFSASRYYIVESSIYRGVNVSTFCLPVSSSLWQDDVVQQAISALDLFNRTFGVYPYSTLNIVEQHASYGGMEYPCQVYITRIISEQIQAETRVSWYLETVVVHEVAHQWWSQLVGDDCVDWGFLDEGLASWSHAYYAEVVYDNWEYFQVATLLDQVRTFYSEYGVPTVINRSNVERPELTSFVDYIQTPLVLEKLRQTIGHDEFILGLQDFMRTGVFGIATLNDLQAAFEQSHGGSLDWFFIPWFSNGYLPDYTIINTLFEGFTSRLTFEIADLNHGGHVQEYCQQIPVLIYGTDGTVIASSEVWVNGSASVALTLSDTPSEIKLNYTGYVLVQLPDSETDYYSTSIIPMSYLADIGPAVVLAVAAVVIVSVLVVRKRRQNRNAG